MKKLFAAILLISMGISSASAQLSGSEVISAIDDYSMYYGFRVGYNMATLRMSSDAISTSPVSGLNFGVVGGFPLGSTELIFEPGILYSMKGGETKYTHPVGGKKVNSEVRMYGFEVPMVFKYDVTLPTMTDISIQPFFGGFFDFGMSGKIKHEDRNKADKDQRQKLKTYANRFKRFDAGLRMGCGIRIDLMYIELAYDLGLSDLGRDTKAFRDLYPYDADNGVNIYDTWEDTAKSGCFSINFGVNF